MKHLWKIIYIVATLFVVTSCDHTDLEGEITLLVDAPSVAVAIPIRLDVPDDLEDIHDVMWSVQDEEGNYLLEEGVIYGEALVEAVGEDWIVATYGALDGNYDRAMLFSPSEPGRYTIEADGFYLQTNPQPITTIEVVVE